MKNSVENNEVVFIDPVVKQLQEAELEIFKHFLVVVNKLNLRYFVHAGTTLGAIRHKGFIPWDDDIDILMPRKDYEIFLKEAQKYLPEHLFLQTRDTDSGYIRNFAKIRNSNTSHIENVVKHLDMNHGIYIDIFVLDGMGNDKNELVNIYRQYKKIDNTYLAKIGLFTFNSFRSFAMYAYYTLRSLFYSKKMLEQMIFEHVTKYDCDDSKYVCDFYGVCNLRDIFERKCFGDGIVGTFEGIEVMLPDDCDTYLTQVYGDYMKFPPVDQRRPPHIDFLDLEKSYKHYIKK